MDFLCDVHISYKLVNFFNANGHKAVHVNQILDKWLTSDKSIANYADVNGLVVITKDADFRNSHFINKSPKRVIRICLGNISNQRLIDIFSQNLTKLGNELQAEVVYIEVHDPLITVFL